MKSKILILLFSVIFSITFAQVKKIKRKDITEINPEWRLIKTVSGTYGIMGHNDKIIVQPIYSKIEKYGEYNKDLALVKGIAGTYGFIDKSGKEVIPAHYDLKEIKSGFSTLYKKYVMK
jgi:WG containing repeat